MKRLAIALGIALVAASALLAYLLGEAREERQRTGELQARLVALQSASGAREVPGAASTPGDQPRPGVAGNISQPAPADSRSIAAAYGQLLDSPEGREFIRAMMRTNMEEQFYDARSELGLSQEEVDKLFDLLAGRMVDGAGDDEQPGAGNNPARVSGEEKQRNYEREIETLLGERYPRWQEYERTSFERQRERRAEAQLRNAISPPGQSIDDAQFRTLQAALTAEEARFEEEARAGRGTQDVLQRMSKLHPRLLDVATAHLDARQIERYRRHLQQQEEMARAIVSAAGAAATRVESD